MHITLFDTLDENFMRELFIDGSNRGLLTESNYIDQLTPVLKGQVKYTKLSQRIGLNYRVLIFEKNNFFLSAFNRKLLQLTEAGFAEKFVNEAVKSEKIRDEEEGPFVLTLEHLGVGFKICLLFLLISFIIFILEFVPSIFAQ